MLFAMLALCAAVLLIVTVSAVIFNGVRKEMKKQQVTNKQQSLPV
jgi:outer membrane lipoprotein-sorting protein